MDEVIIRSRAQQSRLHSDTDDLPAFRRRRLLRYVHQLGEHIDRGDVAAAERCVAQFKETHSQPETEAERWCDVIDSLLADPPYLHANEPQFLRDMLARLEADELPTAKQAAWLMKIAKRRISARPDNSLDNCE